MTEPAAAEIGQEVTFEVRLNQLPEGTLFQWERLYTPPLDDPEEKAIYPYGEGESTDYYFPLEGISEAEILAQNPDAKWPGIEMYFDKLAQQAAEDDRAAPVVEIENGTHNYVLEPDQVDGPAVGQWEPLEGANQSSLLHEVTAEDAYSSYRCVVTLGPPTAAEERSLAEEAASSELTTETEEAPKQLISDTVYVELPPAPAEEVQTFAAPNTAPDVKLSDDLQWLEGLDPRMEYISQDAYTAHNGADANNPYWTRLSGGIRYNNTKYSPTPLTNNRAEVLSAWYGRTIYVRWQGQSGPGTKIDIPAYTGVDYQTGKATLYKKAIKVFNAWVPDTGGSFYGAYLNTVVPDGNTPDGGHITLMKAPIDIFNRVPANYLTNAEGDYIYDAVIVGAATFDEPDLSGAAAWELNRYIGEGYGFLIGHDMIYGYGGVAADPNYTPDPNSTVTPYHKVNTLIDGAYNMAWLMGRNEHYSTANPYASPSMILCGGDYRDKSTLYGDLHGTSILRVQRSVAGDPIKNVRDRTPTNYPYSSSDFLAGKTIIATGTHTNQQVAYGTIWLNYASNSLGDHGSGRLISDTKEDGLMGTNNFYLTTNGNLAMSQIGHTNQNKDTARVDECRILANTMFYISQRQQCQVCQSKQGGNENVHFVHRIYSAEELAKVGDPRYQHTYPINGCYMLMQDIELPAGWQPIQGFTGHFDADSHAVRYHSGLAKDQRRIFDQKTSGWNLGTDPAKGTVPVYAGDTRTTGVARIVGDLNSLFGTSQSYYGYTVKLLGRDNPKFMSADQEFSCEVNMDSKYVLSNLPCIYGASNPNSILRARVYRPDGTEVVEYGTVAGIVPQDFWNSNETRPLFLLEYAPLPPEDRTIWLGQDADFTAAVLSASEYPESKMVWQYKTDKNQEWQTLPSGDHRNLSATTAEPGLPFQYRTVYKGYKQTGDPMTTGTYSTLEIVNAPIERSGLELRLQYEGRKGPQSTTENTNGKGAVLTVKPPESKITITPSKQTVWVQYVDKTGATGTAALPGNEWPLQYGVSFPADKGKDNNGNNQAEYTIRTVYRPMLEGKLAPPPTIIWEARSGIANPKIPVAKCSWNGSKYVWKELPGMDQIRRQFSAPKLKIEVTTKSPVLSNEKGEPISRPLADKAATWQMVESRIRVSYPTTAMDSGNTHFYFGATAENSFGAGDSLKTISATSQLADLFVNYNIDIVPHQGVKDPDKCAANNGGIWTFPDLEVFAPNGIRMGALHLKYDTDEILVDEAKWRAAGITAKKMDGKPDLWEFRSTSGQPLNEKVWENLFRSAVTFISRQPPASPDFLRKDIEWYISENDESSLLQKELLTGSTQHTVDNPPHHVTMSKGFDVTPYDYIVVYGTPGNYPARPHEVGPQVTEGMTLQSQFTPESSGSHINSAVYLGHLEGGYKWDVRNVTGIVYIREKNTMDGYPTITSIIGTARKTFERTNRSALGHGDISDCTQHRSKIVVTLTADPERVYDGRSSRAYLRMVSGPEDVTLRMTMRYHVKNGADTTPATKNPDMESHCIHQNTYTCEVTFDPDVLAKYEVYRQHPDGREVRVSGPISEDFKITPRPLTVHSLYHEPGPKKPRNIRVYDGTMDAVISDILVDNIVPGDPVKLDKASYRGTYKTKAAGEQLGPDGKVLPDRLNRLTENPITRTEPISLIHNDQGDYFISKEIYSGAIFRQPLLAAVSNHTFLYGETAVPELKTADRYSSTEGGAGTDLEISSFVSGDTLTLDPALSSFSIPTLNKNSPVGEYEVTYNGLNEKNYPVLSNYILLQQPGAVTITPRKLTVTVQDSDKMQGSENPAFHVEFRLEQPDGTSAVIGNDTDSDYKDLHLVGQDTIGNTVYLDRGNGQLDMLTKSSNSSNIPYKTDCTIDSTTLYDFAVQDSSLEDCAFCEQYHGFTIGTEHFPITGYPVEINQGPKAPTLCIGTVPGPNGDTQNYELCFEPGLLRVHPPLRFQMKATVPMYVCLYGYRGDGNVVTPTQYGITNHSDGPIQITDIQVANDAWQVTQAAPQDLVAGQIRMKMLDTQLSNGGNPPFSPQRWVVKKDSYLDLPLTCQIAGGNVNPVGETPIAKVTFTLSEFLQK